jgi:hypothetical protein
MSVSRIFIGLMALATIGMLAAGCTASGPAPLAISQPPLPSATPAAGRMYVDHNGTLYQYALPLTQGSKPYRSLQEWPGLVKPPQISVNKFGEVALASPYEIRLFVPPIVSFAASRARLKLKLTPAITQIGPSDTGADLVDLEYDPNNNLWLFNNLGGAGISELRAPISRSSVAALTIAFGAPGTKAAGFTTLVQGRFDAFVDSSQWPPSAPNTPTLLLGQYYGQLRSPSPGSPPSPPVTVTAQFPQPFNPSVGRFPDAHVNTLIGALAADPYRASFYTLDSGTGKLDVYGLPLPSNAKPRITLPCLGGPNNCSHQLEHLFLAP